MCGQQAGVVEVDHRFDRLDDAGVLGLGQARAQRQQRGADLHQRVGEDDLLAARVHGQRGGRAAAHPGGGEAAGDPVRLGVELGVGDLRAFGDQRGPLGATLGPLSEPVVNSHIVSIMHNRDREAR